MAKLDAALIYILFIQHSLIVSGWPVSRSCKPVILGDDRTFNSVLNGTIVERELFHQLGGSKRKLRRSLSKVTEKIENKFTEEPNLVLSSEAPKLNLIAVDPEIRSNINHDTAEASSGASHAFQDFKHVRAQNLPPETPSHQAVFGKVAQTAQELSKSSTQESEEVEIQSSENGQGAVRKVPRVAPNPLAPPRTQPPMNRMRELSNQPTQLLQGSGHTQFVTHSTTTVRYTPHLAAPNEASTSQEIEAFCPSCTQNQGCYRCLDKIGVSSRRQMQRVEILRRKKQQAERSLKEGIQRIHKILEKNGNRLGTSLENMGRRRGNASYGNDGMEIFPGGSESFTQRHGRGENSNSNSSGGCFRTDGENPDGCLKQLMENHLSGLQDGTQSIQEKIADCVPNIHSCNFESNCRILNSERCCDSFACEGCCNSCTCEGCWDSCTCEGCCESCNCECSCDDCFEAFFTAIFS